MIARGSSTQSKVENFWKMRIFVGYHILHTALFGTAHIMLVLIDNKTICF
jgi:hypothetical protein